MKKDKEETSPLATRNTITINTNKHSLSEIYTPRTLSSFFKNKTSSCADILSHHGPSECFIIAALIYLPLSLSQLTSCC